jgi:hypothetical protein
MNRIFLFIALTVVLIVFGVSTLGHQTPDTPTTQTSTQPQENKIPEHVIYGMFLRDLDTFNQKAQEASNRGDEKVSQTYKDFYKGRAGWSDAEFRVLNQIAADCQRQLKVITAKAQKVIDARRKLYFPANKVRPDGQMPPPSPELKQLQAEHDAVILAARDQIRLTLGEQSFQRLQYFLNRTLVPTITVTKLGN